MQCVVVCCAGAPDRALVRRRGNAPRFLQGDSGNTPPRALAHNLTYQVGLNVLGSSEPVRATFGDQFQILAIAKAGNAEVGGSVD